MYLFGLKTYEGFETADTKEPLAEASAEKNVSFSVPFDKSMLFERFIPAVLVNGEYTALTEGVYISNPESLARNRKPYIAPESKKGLLLDAGTIGTDKLDNLNVKRVVYNIPISFILGESTSECIETVKYEYDGQTYCFDGYRLGGFDNLFKYLTDNGYHTTAIVLNDWNSQYPEIIHPLSRNKTAKSKYYAFNTEEEEGVRLMEAVALFLSERYSGGEYGLISDWVIGNEVNQQKIWNFMETSDLEEYTESLEKSFRTFYNAIKSNYANAHVSFSIDHDWNDNYGLPDKFFNARDIVYKFNDFAKAGGNYDWGISIHPYPQPLPKVMFWNDQYAKDETAAVLTPMNLSAITDVMTKEEFLDTGGMVRNMGVTEVGFSSYGGEEYQAAAFAYSYYIIDDNKYIDAYLLNRQSDDADSLKSGLAIGIYDRFGNPKLIADVFKNIDSPAGDDYIPKMLEIIGADSLEEALERAR